MTEVAGATEVTVQTTMVERVTVTEHFLAVEDVPERPARPRNKVIEAA